MDAMKQRFGIEEDLDGITIAGATDALIARMMLEKNGLAGLAGKHHDFAGWLSFLPRAASLAPCRLRPSGNHPFA